MHVKSTNGLPLPPLILSGGRVIDRMPHDIDLQFSSLFQGDPIGSE